MHLELSERLQSMRQPEYFFLIISTGQFKAHQKLTTSTLNLQPAHLALCQASGKDYELSQGH